MEHEEFDRYKTVGLNGMDKDATRRKKDDENDLGKEDPLP
jgi:hypothetical protein